MDCTSQKEIVLCVADSGKPSSDWGRTAHKSDVFQSDSCRTAVEQLSDSSRTVARLQSDSCPSADKQLFVCRPIAFFLLYKAIFSFWKVLFLKNYKAEKMPKKGYSCIFMQLSASGTVYLYRNSLSWNLQSVSVLALWVAVLCLFVFLKDGGADFL